jgi:hypothetical protein
MKKPFIGSIPHDSSVFLPPAASPRMAQSLYLLAFDHTTNSVVAATHGRGMWRLSLTFAG